MAQVPTNILAYRRAGLELEVDEGVEFALRKERQHHESEDGEASPNCIVSLLKGIFLVASLEEEVDQK